MGGIGAAAASAEEEPPSAEEEPPSAEEEPPSAEEEGAGGDLRHDPERANRAAAGWGRRGRAATSDTTLNERIEPRGWGRAGGRLFDGALFLSS